jgi:hypothetical protein
MGRRVGTRRDFADRIDLRDLSGENIVEHLAEIEDFELAMATYRAALAFRQGPLFDKHHTRPAPGAKLHAVRLRCDEKAPSGLALKPTDLWALLTEQIAHFVHF